MRKRSIRHRGKRKKNAVLDLDITSLLDILVIMLVFLLKSYNASGIILNVPKGVTLPTSESSSTNTSGVIIQVSKEKLWVDDQEIIDFTKQKSGLYDHGRRRIIPLFNELVKKKNEVKRISKSTIGAKKFSGIVNLVVDKSVKYSDLKRLMYTCAEAGFKTYKFVVLGQES
jgi:biopolymer transport protein ExbD